MSCLVNGAESFAQWFFLPGMPVTLQTHASAALNGMIYVLGGGTPGNVPLNTCYQYNTLSNTWSAIASMPIGVCYASAAALKGKIYVSGGYAGAAGGTETAALQVYDPTSNIWNTLATMPAKRAAHGSASLNGKLYVVGGSNGATVFNILYEYDPALNSWAIKASMPTARYQLTAEAANGKLYATGGYNSGVISANEQYDPILNSWTAKAVLPVGRYLHSGGTVQDNGIEKIFIVGGWNGSWLSNSQLYDPNSNLWTALPNMQSVRGRVAGAGLANCIYIPGGFNGSAALSSSEIFCFALPLPVELLKFYATCLNSQAKIIWSTASETNNDYFEIEKSYNGQSFESIGKVAGSGTTTVLHNYFFSDFNAFDDAFYYRLKQVDFNGEFSYSNIIAVTCYSEIKAGIIFPNPANDFISLNFTGSMNDFEIDIINARGQIVLKDHNQNKIDISALAQGIYLLRLTEDNNMFFQKFIKE